MIVFIASKLNANICAIYYHRAAPVAPPTPFVNYE